VSRNSTVSPSHRDTSKHQETVLSPQARDGPRAGFFLKTIKQQRQAPMAHACKPSYSKGRDQEDQSSKPAQANSS
jgi:hypothetical protein